MLSRGWAVPVDSPVALRPRTTAHIRRRPREQAYVPAEQPSPAQDARLPPADADSRRAQHPVHPPAQGSQPPRRLSVDECVPCRPVLDRPHRLTSAPGFAAAIRGGRRAGTRTLVLHLQAGVESESAVPAQVGFVVSKAVGNAVTRNQVKRRLRHLARQRLESLPGAAVLVVRALPAAAGATYPELGADLDTALRRVTGADARPTGAGTRRP